MTTLEAIHRLRTLNNEISTALDELTSQVKKDTADPGNRPKITIIQQAVSNFYDIPIQAMTAKARPAKWAIPRQIAMYLCRVHLTYSFQDIGRCFGGRDHGTVAYAEEQVAKMKNADKAFAVKLAQVAEIVIDKLDNEGMPLFEKAP